jgi:flagellar basal body-associated protein FliL
MSIDRTPPGSGTSARQRSDQKNKRWWVWIIVAGVLLVGASWGIGSRVAASIADARFVSALRDDDPQSWLLNMSDAAVAASDHAECASMQAGADPQARIDSYTTFNGAYLVNDAMQYLCPEQLQR